MYYKGTKEKCQAYNNKVSKGENYQGSTQQWATVQECEGDWYILRNDKYSSDLEIVDSIPYKEELI